MYNLYTPHDVKRILNISQSTFQRYCKKNQFFSIRINKRGARRLALPHQTFDGKGLNKILPPREVMKILRISRFSLRKMINRKVLVRYKTREDGYFYKRDEIIKFIKQGGVK